MRFLSATMVLAVFVSASLVNGTGRAALITGVTVSTDMGSFLSVPENMVDGSGLTGELAAGTHAASTEDPLANAWKSATPNTSGNVTFDLGGLFALDAFYVWNHSQNTDGSRGVNGVNVLTSTDGTNFAALVGGPASFAQQAPSAAIPAQEFLVSSVPATHVRFEILSNFNPGFTNVGLSEVQFSGTAVPIPEPSTFVLAALALAGLGFCTWRRRRRA